MFRNAHLDRKQRRGRRRRMVRSKRPDSIQIPLAMVVRRRIAPAYFNFRLLSIALMPALSLAPTPSIVNTINRLLKAPSGGGLRDREDRAPGPDEDVGEEADDLRRRSAPFRISSWLPIPRPNIFRDWSRARRGGPGDFRLISFRRRASGRPAPSSKGLDIPRTGIYAGLRGQDGISRRDRIRNRGRAEKEIPIPWNNIPGRRGFL